MSDQVTDILSALSSQGTDIGSMGLAYARRAYPTLDTLSAAEVYSLGFADGVRAIVAMIPGLVAGVLDDHEMALRLFDPDVLPMPKVDED